MENIYKIKNGAKHSPSLPTYDGPSGDFLSSTGIHDYLKKYWKIRIKCHNYSISI